MSNITKPWLDDWEEVNEIDRGGQGIVTKLQSKNNQKKFAVLKQIVERWRDDKQAKDRLKKEAETLKTLSGVGARVPKLYDSFVGNDSTEAYIVMEHIPGTRFDEWLQKEAPTSPAKSVLITRGLCETIHLCHQHKIGHRISIKLGTAI